MTHSYEIHPQRIALESWVNQAGLLHGTTHPDLAYLQAQPIGGKHAHAQDPTKVRVCATNDVDAAVFYGTVYRPVIDAGMDHRDVAILPNKNDTGEVLSREYFLSEQGKTLIAERLSLGAIGVAYCLFRTGFVYVPEFCEWRSYTDVKPARKTPISSKILSFDVFSLTPPTSNPILRGFLERDYPGSAQTDR